MRRQTKTITCVFVISIWATRSFGTEPTPPASPPASANLQVTAHPHGSPAKFFLKSPKPPFPYHLERQVLATRNLRYNAIVKMTIDHGKIVSVVPAGGNPALAKHLADAIQKSWVADPSMNGTFTFPLKFQMGRGTQMEPSFPVTARPPAAQMR